MEYTYDTRVKELPTMAMTGGTVTSSPAALYLQPMRCGDSDDFIRAIKIVAPTPKPPVNRQLVCFRGCASKCSHIQDLQNIITKFEAAAADVQNLASSDASKNSKMLAPGNSRCGGCSRSPAWDCNVATSPWFMTKPETAEPNTVNLSKLLNVAQTEKLVLTDTWRCKTVRRLEGTQSHATTASAWVLERCQIASPSSNQMNNESRHDEDGHVATYRCCVSVPAIGCEQDTLAEQLFAVGMLRNAKVMNVVMCSVEFYYAAARLLDMRDEAIRTGEDIRVGGLRTSSKSAILHKVPMRGPLPPKLGGYATSPATSYDELCDRQGLTGAMRNASVLGVALSFNALAYGGSLAGIWALLETAFMFDYSTSTSNKTLANSIMNAYVTVGGYKTDNAELDEHLLDILTLSACAYTALKAKAELEDSKNIEAKPCIAVWDDLASVARYRIGDAAFAHGFYNSPGDESSLAVMGLGIAIHDLIDLGADVACGEISNIVPSLVGGELSLSRLQSVYVGLVAALEWYSTHDPFNLAALTIMGAHWWQLSNLRHRPIAMMSRIEPLPEYAISPEKLASPPLLATFSHLNGIAFEAGQAVINAQREEMDRVEATGCEDIKKLINVLVRPVLDYADGKTHHLPIETAFCTEVLKAQFCQRHEEKIRMLWRLTLIMWKCGAMWAAVLASSQYSFEGLANADRARGNNENSRWSMA